MHKCIKKPGQGSMSGKRKALTRTTRTPDGDLITFDCKGYFTEFLAAYKNKSVIESLGSELQMDSSGRPKKTASNLKLILNDLTNDDYKNWPKYPQYQGNRIFIANDSGAPVEINRTGIHQIKTCLSQLGVEYSESAIKAMLDELCADSVAARREAAKLEDQPPV